MKILIAVDLSEATEKIVKASQKIAQHFVSQIWLIHVAQPKPELLTFDAGPKTERDFLAQRFRQEHSEIQTISKRLRKTGIETTALLVRGDVELGETTSDTIMREANKLQVDMIVVGSHGRGMMAQLFVGSVSQGVLSKAECPVLIVPTSDTA
ncbi:MAG: universal stress protein [Cyanobacteria bacterium J06555_13]